MGFPIQTVFSILGAQLPTLPTLFRRPWPCILRFFLMNTCLISGHQSPVTTPQTDDRHNRCRWDRFDRCRHRQVHCFIGRAKANSRPCSMLHRILELFSCCRESPAVAVGFVPGLYGRENCKVRSNLCRNRDKEHGAKALYTHGANFGKPRGNVIFIATTALATVVCIYMSIYGLLYTVVLISLDKTSYYNTSYLEINNPLAHVQGIDSWWNPLSSGKNALENF